MSLSRTTFSHHNEFWANLLIEELVRLGVRHACIAPGSRSTPLTLAAIEHPLLETPTHFDERGLGFFALGVAKASQAPVVIIVTSGSAVANLYPAVVEAYQTQQPLILLTADRPEELIDCGANQAIEQPGIFAHFAPARIDFPAPTQGLDYLSLLKQVDLVVQQKPLAPVHLNCPFREPLYPSENPQSFAGELEPLREWLASGQPIISPQQQEEPIELCLPELPGVIIAGALAPQEQEAAIKLQQQLGWPLLADVQSNLRGTSNVIHYPELALQLPQVRQSLDGCQQFILLGGRLISKTLQQWLEQKEWQFSAQISAHPGPFDGGLLIMQRVKAPLDRVTVSAVKANFPWSAEKINRAIQHQLTLRSSKLSECSLASNLSSIVSNNTVLMLGNSLPIRLFEQRHSGSQAILSNRGASGIDGLLATAAGVARGQQEPVTLLLGDLSLLHDLNSLALSQQVKAPLRVIVLNNDGGNIFDLLPVPDPKTLDDYYRLRHGYQFKAAAQQFGWDYHQVTDWDDVDKAMASKHRVTLIEVITPPGEAVQQLKQALQDVHQVKL